MGILGKVNDFRDNKHIRRILWYMEAMDGSIVDIDRTNIKMLINRYPFTTVFMKYVIEKIINPRSRIFIARCSASSAIDIVHKDNPLMKYYTVMRSISELIYDNPYGYLEIDDTEDTEKWMNPDIRCYDKYSTLPYHLCMEKRRRRIIEDILDEYPPLLWRKKGIYPYRNIIYPYDTCIRV